jgi:hypothetical protein
MSKTALCTQRKRSLRGVGNLQFLRIEQRPALIEIGELSRDVDRRAPYTRPGVDFSDLSRFVI